MSLGIYPEVSIRAARDRRNEAKNIHKSGVDQSARRKIEQAVAPETFEAIARGWFAKFPVNWAPSHSEKVIRRMELDLFPWIGLRPIREITAPELLACLRRIEERGALDTAHRAHQNCGQVFRYAVATGRAERDPSADLRGDLPPAKSGHFASLTEPAKVGALLRAINSCDGSVITRTALRLAPMAFVRPEELRHAEWSEFNFQAAEWQNSIGEHESAGSSHRATVAPGVTVVHRDSGAHREVGPVCLSGCNHASSAHVRKHD